MSDTDSSYSQDLEFKYRQLIEKFYLLENEVLELKKALELKEDNNAQEFNDVKPTWWVVTRDCFHEGPEVFDTKDAAMKNSSEGMNDTHVYPVYTVSRPAHEDMIEWKHRALNAEALIRKLDFEL
jgi:hypothetical protein